MKAPLLVILGAVVLVAGSGLAMMNNACKSSHQNGWCAPISSVRHHVKSGHNSLLGRALTRAKAPLPAPWSVEETDACFIVRDANGKALA